MKNRTLFFTLGMLGLALGSVPLGGCSYLRARSARAAYSQYQNAVASGDMVAARAALLSLVNIEEDVPDYWVQLGRLQIQMGAYRDAYDAFLHAHELDRTNVDVLSTLTQLALIAGEMDLAEEHARSLSLLSPDNPAVTLVHGYTAYRAGELDQAEAAADKLLASAPDDSFAKILKTRVLVAKDRVDEAIGLLEDQHRSVPQDLSAIRNLAAIYRNRGDWANLARIEADSLRLNPRDADVAKTLIEAFLRSGNVAAAGRLSAQLLSPSSSPALTESVLAVWLQYAPHGAVLPNGLQLAKLASGDRRVSFASYYNRVGQPRAAEALLGPSQLPVTHLNARLNAVLANAMALEGRAAEARDLFDRVLSREPDQADALRGRCALELRTGQAKQAVIDAQRLVTIAPTDGDDRLLLAQTYAAAGNKTQGQATLWDAFQDLPKDEHVYAALRSALASAGDGDGQRRLDEEIADERKTELRKELI